MLPDQLTRQLETRGIHGLFAKFHTHDTLVLFDSFPAIRGRLTWGRRNGSSLASPGFDAPRRFLSRGAHTSMSPPGSQIVAPPRPVSAWLTVWSVSVSIAFWTLLIVATLLYAAVALAPKLWVGQRLHDQYAVQQVQLVVLERQAEQLQNVVASLERDPQFAAEMARLDFDALRPGEEVISVGGSLALDPRRQSAPEIRPRVAAAAWDPWLMVLAGNRPVRAGLLTAAAVMILVAFTWLHEPSPN